MNPYVTGQTVRQLREARKMTQSELAERLGVIDKTVSKWETGRGLPDITLLQPLSEALGVSLIELMNGQPIKNRNTSANMLRTKFHVCPLCGNVLTCVGDAVVSCCGISLPPLEPEEAGDGHDVTIEQVEDERFLTFDHPMTKEHFLSFAAFVTSDRVQLVKFYPEGNAQTRMRLYGSGDLYFCCNRHGLFRKRLRRRK